MEFYKAVTKYLKSCNIQFSESFFRSRMKSHPDYPALVSFTDTLDEIGLPYSAVVVDKEKYPELSYPLLAYCTIQDKSDFVLVTVANEFENGGNALLQAWNGIAVMIQSGISINYSDHDKELANETSENRNINLAILFGVILSISIFSYDFKLIPFILSILCLAGIYACSLIVMHSMGIESALIEQLCSADGSTGCDKVMNSKVGKGWAGFGWGDAGLIYFSGIALFLMLLSITNANDEYLAILSIPFALITLFSAFSIYYQGWVVKSWCRMCLIVVGLNGLQSLIFFFFILPGVKVAFPIIAFGSFFICMMLPALVWVNLKALLLKTNEIAKYQIASLKWERDPKVFLSLLNKQRKVDDSIWEDDLILGDASSAPIQITVACNPYCHPCAKAHKELEELRKLYAQEISIVIRFAVQTDDISDTKNVTIQHILTAYQPDKEEIITNWFAWMDFKAFSKYYPVYPDKIRMLSVLQRYAKWTKESRIRHTPTLFVNGHELPIQYKIKDLKLLVNELIENITPHDAVANADA